MSLPCISRSLRCCLPHALRRCIPRALPSAFACGFISLLCAAFAAFPALLAQSAPQAAPPAQTATQSDLPAQAASKSGLLAQTVAQSDLPDAPGVASAANPEPVPTGPTIVFDTSMGRLTCKTFDQQAPNAVANFIGLAEGTKDWKSGPNGAVQHDKRFYDGLTFHRVIPGFMIQGGDPVGDGTGDAGYYFDDEIVPGLTFSEPGRLAMANSGPNTNSSQFFITEAAFPELDGKYTIFGQCDAHSTLLADSIALVPRDSNDKPLTPVVINRVTIVRDGQPMPPLPAPPPAPAATPAPAILPPTPN